MKRMEREGRCQTQRVTSFSSWGGRDNTAEDQQLLPYSISEMMVEMMVEMAKRLRAEL